MKYILTGTQMREADRYTIEQIGIPSLVLMERAALGVVAEIEKRISGKQKVLVVCGTGNNGGDGYAIARLLHLKGHNVNIWSVGNDASRSEENRLQKNICEHYKITSIQSNDNEKYDLVIDCIFGTGLSREITGAYYEIIEHLNFMDGFKIAVDLPSGVQDTTGKIMGIAFQADLTVAIAYLKRGEVIFPGMTYAGELSVTDIGITEEALPQQEMYSYTFEKDDLGVVYPKRKVNSHKGSYGRTGLIVGSRGMSGAAYLAAKAAYKVGCGLVRIYTHEDNRIILQQLLPEAIVTTYQTFDQESLQEFLDWSDVIAMGSGLGVNDISKEIVSYVIRHNSKPCVLDADALNIMAAKKELLKLLHSSCVLTPHLKEMSRLCNCDIKILKEHKEEILDAFVKTYNVICVLKDARTYVQKAKENLYINMTGNSSMAKGGSGDVLTGMIAGIIAQGKISYDAACIAVNLHGLAGDHARDEKSCHSVMASDLIESISEVLKEI